VPAFAPDANEATSDLIKRAPAALENGIIPADEMGFVYYDKQKFHTGFAADLSKEKAALCMLPKDRLPANRLIHN
jgi:hypothetical protein